MADREDMTSMQSHFGMSASPSISHQMSRDLLARHSCNPVAGLPFDVASEIAH
jgi:hypothetical protein